MTDTRVTSRPQSYMRAVRDALAEFEKRELEFKAQERESGYCY